MTDGGASHSPTPQRPSSSQTRTTTVLTLPSQSSPECEGCETGRTSTLVILDMGPLWRRFGCARGAEELRANLFERGKHVSASIIEPVVKLARSELRKTAISATSSGIHSDTVLAILTSHAPCERDNSAPRCGVTVESGWDTMAFVRAMLRMTPPFLSNMTGRWNFEQRKTLFQRDREHFAPHLLVEQMNGRSCSLQSSVAVALLQRISIVLQRANAA
jgi:hypothetical protein